MKSKQKYLQNLYFTTFGRRKKNIRLVDHAVYIIRLQS
jgi:hypothetical protein